MSIWGRWSHVGGTVPMDVSSSAVLFALLLVSTAGTCHGRMVVSPPSKYVSLSGNLEVPYVVVETSAEDWSWNDDDDDDGLRAEASLVRVDTDETLASISFRQVVGEDGRGKVVFRCGTILHSGKCTVNITISKINRTVEKLVSEAIAVEWPSFTLIAPRQLETYTTDVTVTLESTGIACHPPAARRSSIDAWLEVEFAGANGDLSDPGRQYVQSANDFYATTSRDVTVRCTHFDQAGYYRVLLRTKTSSSDEDVIVVSSQTIRVVWSEEYKVRPQSASIFPCPLSQAFSVHYEHPACILSRDRIRVFGRLRKSGANSPAASPVIIHYVFERRVDKDESMSSVSTATFPCRLFNDSYVEYCFKYVSVSRRGVVSEVRSICVPTYGRTESSTGVVDGGWGGWSEWSVCSATCGHGTRIRHRFCDSPPPSYNGIFCEGRVTDAEKCHSDQLCTERPTTRAPVDEYRMAEGCQCGCELNVSSFRPVYIASSARRCSTTSTWILKGVPGAALHFTFLHFDLNDTTECLQVRDGGHASSELLLHETGRKIPSSVTSSSRLALLRYQRKSTNQRNGSGAGFVTRIELASPGLSLLNLVNVDAAAASGVQDYRLLSNPVHLTATLFCSVLLLVSLGLAVHHFVHLKRQRTRAAAEASLLSTPFGSSPLLDHAHPDAFQQQLVTSTTSLSDLSMFDDDEEAAAEASTSRRLIVRPRAKNKQRKKRLRLGHRGHGHRRLSAGRQRSFEVQSPINSVGTVASKSRSSSSCNGSPEDYLRDSKIFQSSSSPMTSPGSPPLFLPIHKLPSSTTMTTTSRIGKDSSRCVTSRGATASASQPAKLSPLTPGMTRKLPVATVSPQPARIVSTKTYCAEKLKKLREGKEAAPGPTSPTETDDGFDDVDRSKGASSQKLEPAARSQQQRLMASASEASLADAEFEYDYYDYNVHETPGSYFTEATSWLPPYVPRPPFNHLHRHQLREEDEDHVDDAENGATVYPLHDFRRSVLTTTTDDESSAIVQESSADSDAMTASGTSDRVPVVETQPSEINSLAKANNANSRPASKSKGEESMFG